MEKISLEERLIFALDVKDLKEGKAWVQRLGSGVSYYKLGLELLMSGEYFELVDWLMNQNKKVFCDIKLYDIPETVKRATKNLVKKGVDMMTVHGEENIVKGALEGRGNIKKTKILAVTLLTSIGEKEYEKMGYKKSLKEQVLFKAQEAIRYGCDGVIISGVELKFLREKVRGDYMIVVPGIRVKGVKAGEEKREDDQKRVTDVRTAMEEGADHIVIGRMIRESKNINQTIEKIQKEIEVGIQEKNKNKKLY